MWHLRECVCGGFPSSDMNGLTNIILRPRDLRIFHNTRPRNRGGMEEEIYNHFSALAEHSMVDAAELNFEYYTRGTSWV